MRSWVKVLDAIMARMGEASARRHGLYVKQLGDAVLVAIVPT
jgi:class 3 adenylate cyclase